MTNPYLQRVVSRMDACGALDQLHAHWSSRWERRLNLVGFWLDRAGLARLGLFYVRLVGPLTDWLAERQRVFLRGYL